MVIRYAVKMVATTGQHERPQTAGRKISGRSLLQVTEIFGRKALRRAGNVIGGAGAAGAGSVLGSGARDAPGAVAHTVIGCAQDAFKSLGFTPRAFYSVFFIIHNQQLK